MKRMLKVFVVGLVLAMAVTFSVSAATAQVELTKRMYYVSGSHLSFSAAQAQYRGTIYPDSTCECKIYLFAKTANGNREISSRVLTPGSSVFSSPWYGPYNASDYNATAWYPYAQPYNSGSSGTGGHCTVTAAGY